MIKILELFGGIGAPRKALINLGIEHKAIDYVEWNEKAVRSYNAMFDNRYKPESIVGYSLKPDILIHGSPCQDFSIGGKQYGGNIADGTRSSLMFETLKIIEGLGGWKPHAVIWENVKNVLSGKMVGAFSRYLKDMETLGYRNSYEILDARDFGIPQARERIFTVSTLDDKPFNFNNLECKKMRPISEFLEEDVPEHYFVTQPSMVSRLPDMPINKDIFGGRMLDEVIDYVYTITTKQMRVPNSGVVRMDDDRFRYLTEKECWRLMGFEDKDFQNALGVHPGRPGMLNSALYHQAGNSIVVDVLEAIFKELLFPRKEQIFKGQMTLDQVL
ncbi:DNA cytosine methyltransferase [Salinicoccus sesuvii]|uniref:Cytosine-specific methyltransferase n=1 Tax=Salinicoccus sesuvii TaxID=868281 RepID=A0ABV7N5K2_9STAP